MSEPFSIALWGIAAGRGSTEGAARGAFTVREYPTVKAAKDAVKIGIGSK